jgi:hypothetical protein
MSETQAKMKKEILISNERILANLKGIQRQQIEGGAWF